MLLAAKTKKSERFCGSTALFSAMEYALILDWLMEFVGILNDARKLTCKNRKLMFFVVLSTLFVFSVLYVFNVVSIKPLIKDLLMNVNLLLVTSSSSPQFFSILTSLQQDIKRFIGVEWIYLGVMSIVSLFVTISIILASAIAHSGKNISIGDHLLRTIRSWRRPFVTSFYVTLLHGGYLFLLWLILFPVALFAQGSVALRALTTCLYVLAFVFEAYLIVVWSLALVVSVLEEKCGIQALGKAADIVKGMRLQGFLLNLLFTILSYAAIQGIRLISTKRSTVWHITVGLIVVNSILLVKLFAGMVYTVFYYRCKKMHGEEVELQGSEGSMEYSKVPTMPLISENIP